MLILSVPFKNNHSILTNRIEEYDLIEYRLDYAEILSEIDTSLFNSKTIITIRENDEGGIGSFNDIDKLHLIKNIYRDTDSLIDIEYKFLIKHPALIINEERTIISLHTHISNIDFIMQFMHSGLQAKFIKLAVNGDDFSSFIDLINLIPSKVKNSLILIPMNPLPEILRMLYKLFSSIATYVYLNEQIALNQPSINLANKCRISKIDINSDLYLIIGGEQVKSSLSVDLYNQFFAELELNAVMLPFVTDNINEVIPLITWIKHNAKLRGVAITMPYKNSLHESLVGFPLISNTWLPSKNLFYNTDEISFHKAINRLGVDTQDAVLILGTGATARTAETVLQINGFQNITKLSRQEILNRNEGNHQFRNYYDLLINCTPYGINSTDDTKFLPEFKALIDLPYGAKPTDLVSKAQKHKISYIDGFTFWQWQAEEQAKLFGINERFKLFIENRIKEIKNY